MQRGKYDADKCGKVENHICLEVPFIVNAYFIFLASAVILSVLKTPKVRQLTEREWKKLRFKMFRNTLIVLLPSLVLGYFMING